jgi:hypothetical protein
MLALNIIPNTAKHFFCKFQKKQPLLWERNLETIPMVLGNLRFEKVHDCE